MSYMSEEGYKKLLADLKELEAKRPEVVRQIAEARDKGDLSENAEYDAAKEAQGLLEMRINELKLIIADAKIIDTTKLSSDTVQVLIEIFASRRFASLSGTMVYCIVAPVLVFLRPTFVSTCTVSVLSFDVSMIFASAIVILSSLILISSRPCASFAASYSAFSDKSPLSRASAI